MSKYSPSILGTCRRRCKLEFSSEIFFSITDYRNNYFLNDNPEKIFQFYQGFKDREELIEWMKERPKGVCNIREVEGNKEVIVVIPTPDFDGNFAMECRNNIFKGLHIIFAESAEIPDNYFNGAHNVNMGIQRALNYSPKWLILSGEDMQKVDDVKILLDELSAIDHQKIKALFLSPGMGHSIPAQFSRPRKFFPLFLLLNFLKKWKRGRLNRLLVTRRILKLYSKFEVSYLTPRQRSPNLLAFERGFSFINSGPILIISSEYITNDRYPLFDETFVNDNFETDTAIDISFREAKYELLDYRIRNLPVTRLGKGINRYLRGVAGATYLCYKWENKLR